MNSYDLYRHRLDRYFYLGFLERFWGFCGTMRHSGDRTLRAAVFINFVPVSGVLLGWLLLDESINLSLLTGAACHCGVYLTNKIKNT